MLHQEEENLNNMGSFAFQIPRGPGPDFGGSIFLPNSEPLRNI